MFNFFKKKNLTMLKTQLKNNFDIELTASILPMKLLDLMEILIESELSLLIKKEIKKISAKIGKKEEKILEIIEEYSNK